MIQTIIIPRLDLILIQAGHRLIQGSKVVVASLVEIDVLLLHYHMLIYIIHVFNEYIAKQV